MGQRKRQASGQVKGRGETATSALRAVPLARQEAVQVAVAAVRVVERAGDVVVHVVAVRDAFMPAGGSVRLAAFNGSAGVRPPPVHLELVLVEVAGVGRVM